MRECLSNVETPCFIFNQQEFDNCVNGFYEALHQNFEKVIIGYSIKTNSLPYAVSLAKKQGCFAEVVSDDELKLAKICGFSTDNIIFNGPMKSKDEFLRSIIDGAKVNIETHREILWLRELPTDRVFDVGIRVNVNISEVSPADAEGNDDFSRFGFCEATNELDEAVSSIAQIPQVHIAGLHFHRTTHTRSVSFYRNLCDYAARIVEKYNLSLEYLDLGGGFFGIFKNAPTFSEYSKAIYETLSQHGLENLTIIVEPGNALVASAFSFISKVIDTKRLPNCKMVTIDGSRNNVDPFFRKSRYLLDVLRKTDGRQLLPLQIVSGATCLEYDKLIKIENEPEIFSDDILVFNNVGAYTMTLSPMFINYFPRVYAMNNNQICLVRDKWSACELIQKSIIVK